MKWIDKKGPRVRKNGRKTRCLSNKITIQKFCIISGQQFQFVWLDKSLTKYQHRYSLFSFVTMSWSFIQFRRLFQNCRWIMFCDCKDSSKNQNLPGNANNCFLMFRAFNVLRLEVDLTLIVILLVPTLHVYGSTYYHFVIGYRFEYYIFCPGSINR